MQLLPLEIHIWNYKVNKVDYLDEINTAILSADENARAAAFINESDRIGYVTVHRFLRTVLARYVSIDASSIQFRKGAFDKPFVVNNKGIHFNLSYRGDFALLAVSDSCEPGVDIEQIRPIDDSEAFCKNYFSRQEGELIDKVSESERLEMIFTFWTFKEAVIKALGIGFSRHLTEYDLSSFIERPTNPLAADDSRIWTIQKLPAAEGYKAALAFKGDGFKIVFGSP